VPIYLCSLAFGIATPSSANPGQPFERGKLVLHTAKTKKSNSSRNRIALPLQGQQDLKYVHRYIRNNDACLVTVRRRSQGPFSIIDSVLEHYHLPLELKYLAVIESELKPTALSRVGARGPWQLMPGTAHVFGLQVNHRSDDRMNYYKSTAAAAKYLRDLHKEFGDWLLVLAAYNGGPRPVYRAIHKSHSRNFWVLQRYLPRESREHVKKFIATAYYFERSTPASEYGSLPTTASGPASALAPASAAKVPVIASKTNPVSESANDKFARLMHESAVSLKASNDLLYLTME